MIREQPLHHHAMVIIVCPSLCYSLKTELLKVRGFFQDVVDTAQKIVTTDDCVPMNNLIAVFTILSHQEATPLANV